MKKHILWIPALALMLWGCTGDRASEGSDASQPTVSLHQELASERASFDRNTDLRMDVPQLGLTDVLVRGSSNGTLDGDICGEVYLLADQRYGIDRHADHYLVVAIEDGLVARDLREQETLGAMDASLMLVDVDGDTDREILVQEKMDDLGGAGQYRSRVFDYKDGELTEMFCSAVDGKLIDTGFSVALQLGQKFEIYNRIADYRAMFMLGERPIEYFENWYKEDGSVQQWELLLDSFCGFFPVDVDGDGVYEIECVQYTWLTNHTDFMGWAHSIMKYDAVAEEFRIMDAWFEVQAP